MSSIVTHIEREKELTTHTLEGKINGKDIITTIEEYYMGSPTRDVIWDYTETQFSNCKDESIQTIVIVAAKYAKLRVGGKNALILPGDLQFGLGRVFEALAEAEDLPIPTRSFRSIQEAVQWLNESDTE